MVLGTTLSAITVYLYLFVGVSINWMSWHLGLLSLAFIIRHQKCFRAEKARDRCCELCQFCQCLLDKLWIMAWLCDVSADIRWPALKCVLHVSPEKLVHPPWRCIYASLNCNSLGGASASSGCLVQRRTETTRAYVLPCCSTFLETNKRCFRIPLQLPTCYCSTWVSLNILFDSLDITLANSVLRSTECNTWPDKCLH